MTKRASDAGTVSNELPDPDDFGLVVRIVSSPVVAAPGTLFNGTRTPIGAVAVSILPANTDRKTAIIQNVGMGTIFVGIAGVTAATGIEVLPRGTLTMSAAYAPVQELFAIRDTVDSIAFATEVV